jgi:hypothetical protein
VGGQRQAPAALLPEKKNKPLLGINNKMASLMDIYWYP